MNKYQQFAVNHYLSDYEEGLDFQEILSALYGCDMELVTVCELYDSILSLSYEEIADDMYQMAQDLERLL